MQIARWIRAHRKEEGLSQEAAAKRIGVTRLTWLRWEGGAYCPEPRILVKLAIWFKTPIEVLELMLDADHRARTAK